MMNLSLAFVMRFFLSCGYNTAKYLSTATAISDTTETTPLVHTRFPPVSRGSPRCAPWGVRTCELGYIEGSQI